MNTSRKSGSWQLWLASFLAIGGAIAYFADCAKATQLTPDNTLGEPRGVLGELLINPDSGQNIRIPGAGGNINIDSPIIIAIPDAGGSITLDPSNSVPVSGAGGSISVRASSIVLDDSKIASVPEPSSTLGILTFAVFSAAKVLKGKQKKVGFQKWVVLQKLARLWYIYSGLIVAIQSYTSIVRKFLLPYSRLLLY